MRDPPTLMGRYSDTGAETRGWITPRPNIVRVDRWPYPIRQSAELEQSARGPARLAHVLDRLQGARYSSGQTQAEEEFVARQRSQQYRHPIRKRYRGAETRWSARRVASRHVRDVTEFSELVDSVGWQSVERAQGRQGKTSALRRRPGA